jgi:hypothetical protein
VLVLAGDGGAKITVEQLALLSRSLEFGMCDDYLLAQLFDQLDIDPKALLPQQLRLLSQTAFFLWKSGRGDFAKRVLFTCLAWYLPFLPETSDARSAAQDARSIAENLQYMFAKEDSQVTIEQIVERARGGKFPRPSVPGYTQPTPLL